jgi:hypothetical protein
MTRTQLEWLQRRHPARITVNRLPDRIAVTVDAWCDGNEQEAERVIRDYRRAFKETT